MLAYLIFALAAATVSLTGSFNLYYHNVLGPAYDELVTKAKNSARPIVKFSPIQIPLIPVVEPPAIERRVVEAVVPEAPRQEVSVSRASLAEAWNRFLASAGVVYPEVSSLDKAMNEILNMPEKIPDRDAKETEELVLTKIPRDVDAATNKLLGIEEMIKSLISMPFVQARLQSDRATELIMDEISRKLPPFSLSAEELKNSFNKILDYQKVFYGFNQNLYPRNFVGNLLTAAQRSGQIFALLYGKKESEIKSNADIVRARIDELRTASNNLNALLPKVIDGEIKNKTSRYLPYVGLFISEADRILFFPSTSHAQLADIKVLMAANSPLEAIKEKSIMVVYGSRQGNIPAEQDPRELYKPFQSNYVSLLKALNKLGDRFELPLFY